MMLYGILWIIGVWALLVVGIGFAATVPLMRRRVPDTPDTPDQHAMPYQEVKFPSRDGLTLGGWWIPAPGETRGTVIMCPGQNGSMDKDVPQAVSLHQAGFNVLMFDFRAHGRSEGQTVTLGGLEQADLFGALDYVESEQGVTRAGVLGFSMGAGVALMVAAQDKRIAALVVDGAYPRLVGLLAVYLRERGLPGVLARGFAWLILLLASLRTGYQLYRANPVDLVDRVAAPALLIHGEDDPFATTEAIKELAARIQAPAEVWRVAGAGHREAFAHHPDDYSRRVLAWLDTHLAG